MTFTRAGRRMAAWVVAITLAQAWRWEG